MIQPNQATSTLRLARVTHVYPEGQSMDVIFLDTGDYGRNIQVMSPMAGTDFGFTSGIPSPEEEGHEANLTDDPGKRTITCVVASAGGVNICLGFLFPQVTQMAFTSADDANRTVMRHPSDFYTTIDDAGNMTMRHPTGESFVAFGEAGPVDLTERDFDKRFKIARNTGREPTLKFSVSYGGNPKEEGASTDWSLPFSARALLQSEPGEAVAGGLFDVDGPAQPDAQANVPEGEPLREAKAIDGPMEKDLLPPGGGMTISKDAWSMGHNGLLQLKTWDGDVHIIAGRGFQGQCEGNWTQIAHGILGTASHGSTYLESGGNYQATVAGGWSTHAGGAVELRANGACTLQAGSGAMVSAGAGAVVKGSTEITLEAPIIRIKGALILEGGSAMAPGNLHISAAGIITMQAPNIIEETPNHHTTGIHSDQRGFHCAVCG